MLVQNMHCIRDDQLEKVIENIINIHQAQGYITKEQFIEAMKDLRMYAYRRDQIYSRLSALNIVPRTTVKENTEQEPVVKAKKKVRTRKTVINK